MRATGPFKKTKKVKKHEVGQKIVNTYEVWVRWTFLQLHRFSSGGAFCLQRQTTFFSCFVRVIQGDEIMTRSQCMHAVSYCGSSLSLCVHVCECAFVYQRDHWGYKLEFGLVAKAFVGTRICAGLAVHSSLKGKCHYNANFNDVVLETVYGEYKQHSTLEVKPLQGTFIFSWFWRPLWTKEE